MGGFKILKRDPKLADLAERVQKLMGNYATINKKLEKVLINELAVP